MSTRPKRGPSLFEAAGLEQDAPRPLADKLRPTKLSEVVGQDHLLGPDGTLTRMLETRSLGSLVLPVPGGPQKMSEPSERVATMRESAPSGPSR